jgi:uncharacterized LabA/DUF88 family protein
MPLSKTLTCHNCDLPFQQYIGEQSKIGVRKVDRYAIFVDAGYLWAGGIDTVFPSTDDQRLTRSDVVLQYRNLINYLRERAKVFAPGRELLRVYWYDAAPDRTPTPEQRKVASVAETKIRIGHLTANGVQKNVDTLLLLDLNNLARQHSIQTAILLAGDGDFLEGVTSAQEFGIKVYLWGIGSQSSSVSPELVMEVDDYSYLEYKDLSPFFERRPRPQAAHVKWESIERFTPQDEPPITYERIHTIEPDDLRRTGAGFALRYQSTASPGEVQIALESFPQIPDHVHYRLLRYTFEVHQLTWGQRLNSQQITALRDGFKDQLLEIDSEGR